MLAEFDEKFRTPLDFENTRVACRVRGGNDVADDEFPEIGHRNGRRRQCRAQFNPSGSNALREAILGIGRPASTRHEPTLGTETVHKRLDRRIGNAEVHRSSAVRHPHIKRNHDNRLVGRNDLHQLRIRLNLSERELNGANPLPYRGSRFFE